MGKYIFFIVLVLMIAFAANYFGYIHVSWLDMPVSSKTYKQGVERIQNEADKQATVKD